jgi:hypothetical protein
MHSAYFLQFSYGCYNWMSAYKIYNFYTFFKNVSSEKNRKIPLYLKALPWWRFLWKSLLRKRWKRTSNRYQEGRAEAFEWSVSKRIVKYLNRNNEEVET